jgi:hypothetical protein
MWKGEKQRGMKGIGAMFLNMMVTATNLISYFREIFQNLFASL